jgi:hypothetical protein
MDAARRVGEDNESWPSRSSVPRKPLWSTPRPSVRNAWYPSPALGPLIDEGRHWNGKASRSPRDWNWSWNWTGGDGHGIRLCVLLLGLPKDGILEIRLLPGASQTGRRPPADISQPVVSAEESDPGGGGSLAVAKGRGWNSDDGSGFWVSHCGHSPGFGRLGIPFAVHDPPPS